MPDICPYCGQPEDCNMPHCGWCCEASYDADHACDLLERSEVEHDDTWYREAASLVMGDEE
jgi:hypothetical protein